MTTQKDVIRYIVRQRKKGYDDEAIRTKMYVNGYRPEDMNKYFAYIDNQHTFAKNAMIVTAFLLIIASSVFVLGKNVSLTAAAPWSWPWSSPSPYSTYDCGEDYPAGSEKDLSRCIADDSATENILFCYVNNTVTADEISPSSVNDDWYSDTLGKDISSITEIDTSALLESSIVLPWTASYDNVDCFSWTHGTTRTSDWHLCNSSQENLVFYYGDSATGDINETYGGISTELGLNSSYYLCYDELECTTQTTACDESANEYCVGRMNDTYGSAWYPCDTTLDADYYRCCVGGCNGIEMTCGEYLLQSDGSEVAFNECDSDGTSGCCDAETDCVYDSECYSEDD
ncbi:MAG: hypothetical protein AB1333_04900, partial [Patescibacteria group bacterium]